MHAFADNQLSTTVIDQGGREQLWIGYASYDTGANVGGFTGTPLILVVQAMNEEKWFTLSEIDTSIQGTWLCTAWPDEFPVTVRLTQESDAVSAVSMSGGLAIPLPLELLVALHSNEGATVPNLYAMSEDDGFVATMMLNSDTGLYVRYSSQWHKITDDDVVDGLNVTEVDGANLEMFDQFDRAGQLVHVSAMYKDGLPVQTYDIVPEGPLPVGEAPIMASGLATKQVPMLSSADDLPAAIEAANENPDLRWWVERRILALGLESDLPWSSS